MVIRLLCLWLVRLEVTGRQPRKVVGVALIGWQEEIAKKISAHKGEEREMKNTTIEMHRVPLELSELQPKVLHDWRLRPWLFRGAFGEYPTFISVLRIGDIVFLGTPCDFSGEFNASLDSLAAREHIFPYCNQFQRRLYWLRYAFQIL